MLRVGIAGLGLVGSALARRAVRHGATVSGYDVDPQRAAALADEGVTAAADPAALAAESDAVVVCVFDGAQLDAVVRALVTAPQPPRVIASAVTADPATVEAVARRCAEAGVDFIDAPFSGSSAQIERGEATLLLGATGTTMIIWQPLVALLGDRRHHVGDPGMATRAKLATNLVLGLNRAALAEGIAFAESLGLAPARFVEVLRDSPGYSRAVDVKGDKMVRGDFAPEGRLAQHHKDVVLILGEASTRGQPLPLSNAHERMLADAMDAGIGDLDNSALLLQLQRSRRPIAGGGVDASRTTAMNAPTLASHKLKLPNGDGKLATYILSAPRQFPRKQSGQMNRVAYAAAHVVADPLGTTDPWIDSAIDWDKTIAFRKHLWGLGLGVAEAMDTAQRGMGMDWPTSLELIRRSVEASRDIPGAKIASGAGTDHLAPAPGVTVDDVIRAYEEQCEAVEAAGSPIILMASRALAACAKSPDDYAKVYDRILSQVKQPVMIHWLGEMFDPALAGYWGSGDHMEAMKTAVAVIRANAAKVDGVKISLLDKDKEIVMRRQLPAGVRMYTGDDFNYAELIEGDAAGYSDALLGIFDAIAPAAAAALVALAQGDREKFHEIFAPTVPLSRHIFRAPTRFYKTGVVFMAWLNGHQDHFTMVGGQQSARSIGHFAEIFRLADRAGLLRDPELAVSRMKQLLSVHGISQ
jgi:3-hydroxyisobutyrate dehydrogenase-like beta-hydroxyacid dehydrogenase